MIEFETNRYSVPSGNIADIMTIKATEHEILIYDPELDLIAGHERAPARSNRRLENPEHFKPKKDRYSLEPVREAFLAIGDAAPEFLAGLTQRYPRNCGFHARYILRLKENYETDDIHKALIHAQRYQAFDAKSVERIPHARAVPRTLESIRNEQAGRELEQALPKIAPRPLEEYGELFVPEADHEKSDDAGRNRDRIRQHLTTLKLTAMRKSLDTELAKAAKQPPTPTQLLERLLAIEANALTERRIERRIRESKMPERKLLSDFDFVFQTGVDKAQIMELAKLDFVERKQGLVWVNKEW